MRQLDTGSDAQPQWESGTTYLKKLIFVWTSSGVPRREDPYKDSLSLSPYQQELQNTAYFIRKESGELLFRFISCSVLTNSFSLNFVIITKHLIASRTPWDDPCFQYLRETPTDATIELYLRYTSTNDNMQCWGTPRYSENEYHTTIWVQLVEYSLY